MYCIPTVLAVESTMVLLSILGCDELPEGWGTAERAVDTESECHDEPVGDDFPSLEGFIYQGGAEITITDVEVDCAQATEAYWKAGDTDLDVDILIQPEAESADADAECGCYRTIDVLLNTTTIETATVYSRRDRTSVPTRLGKTRVTWNPLAR